jgi:hypothetical protein
MRRQKKNKAPPRPSETRDKLPIQETQYSFKQLPLRHPQYVNIIDRINSFKNWPTTCEIHPSKFAFYGLFFTGTSDLVRCFQCGIGLKDWTKGDDPLKEHLKHSKDCPFISQYIFNPSDNLPPEMSKLLYSTISSRIESFKKCPETYKLPQQLAAAGMYYMGEKDFTMCFVCDLKLHNWDASDDTWLEHTRWSPSCKYILYMKGQRYIDAVKKAVKKHNLMEKDLLKSEPAKKLLEMGYSSEQIKWANSKIKVDANDCNMVITEDMLLSALEHDLPKKNINPIEENQQVKKCTKCTKNDINILYMPCTHHRFCETCAEKETHCGICKRRISSKIKTYMS